MALYKAYNGPAPTTAAQQKVTTGTAIKTLMQLATDASHRLKVKEWGIDFDGSAAATPITVELVETDVAATITAYAAADLIKADTGTPASHVTNSSGYTATVEGTITATRVFDAHLVAPSNQFFWQWPLGEGFTVAVSKFLRVRVTAGTAVNALCWVKWEEE